MKLFRIFLTLAWYTGFLCAFVFLFHWTFADVPTPRVAVVMSSSLALLLFLCISEVHETDPAGYREDFFDYIEEGLRDIGKSFGNFFERGKV